VEDVLRLVATRTGRPLPWSLRDQVFKATSGGKVVIRAAVAGQPDWLIQMGLTPLAARRVANQYRAMSTLSGAALPAAAKRLIPVPIFGEEFGGYFVGVRHYRPGRRAGELTHDPEQRRLLCGEAEHFLVDFQSALARLVEIDDGWLDSLVRRPFSTVRQWFTAAEWADGYGRWFDEQARWVEERLRGVTLPVVPSHGDFVPDNCVWDDKAQALGQVIDWELYDSTTLPLIDWVSFIAEAYAPEMKAAMRTRGEDPAHARYYGYPEAFLQQPLLGLMHSHLDRMRIDRELLLPLLFMWWIRRMHDWAPLLLYYPDWRRLRVLPILERWKTVLARVA
jgi:hypothetical protein